jgi:hypothetical protein
MKPALSTPKSREETVGTGARPRAGLLSAFKETHNSRTLARSEEHLGSRIFV